MSMSGNSGVGGSGRGGQTGRTSGSDEGVRQEEAQQGGGVWGWFASVVGGGHTVQEIGDVEAPGIPEAGVPDGPPLGTRGAEEIKAACKMQGEETQGVNFKEFAKAYELAIFGSDDDLKPAGEKLMEIVGVLAELGEEGGGISGEDQERYEEHPMQFMMELHYGENSLADKIEHHGDLSLDPDDPDYLPIRTLLVDIKGAAQKYLEANILEATRDYEGGLGDDFENCVNRLDDLKALRERRMVAAEQEAIMEAGFSADDFQAHLEVSEELEELSQKRYVGVDETNAFIDERCGDDVELAGQLKEMQQLAFRARAAKTDAGDFGLTPDEEGLNDSLLDQFHAISKRYVEGLAMEYFQGDPICKEAFEVVYKFREAKTAEFREAGVPEEAIAERVQQAVSDMRAGNTVEAKEFDAYYRAMQQRMAVMRGVTGFEYREKDIEGYDVGFMLMGCILGEDAARSVYAQGTNVKRVAIAGAAVGAATVLGPTAAATYGIGGIFAYHMTKKAVGAAKARIEGAGLLYDVKGAQRDKEIRTPHLQKIFMRGFDRAEQMQALEELMGKGLLFQEDIEELMDFNPELVEAFLEGGQEEVAEGETLFPSRAKLFEEREPFMRALSLLIDDPEHGYQAYRAPEQLDALNQMDERGILYREDLLRADGGVQREFLENSENYDSIDDLPSLAESKKFRNAKLWVVRGQNRTIDERLQEVIEMIGKGVFFQEDLIMLQTKAANGDGMAQRLEVKVREMLMEKGMAVSELPTTKKYYKEESALRDEHDALRRPILMKLRNLGNAAFLAEQDPPLSAEEVQERIYENLKLLWDQGICFDKDIEGVDEAVLDRLREYVNGHWTGYAVDNLPSRESFYESGYQKRMVKAAYMSAEAVASTVTRPFDIATTDIVSGALVGVKGVFVASIEGLEETYGTLTVTEPPRALSERVAEMLPPNERIRKNAQWCINKGIGGMKWGVVAGAIGAWIGSIFPVAGTLIGAKIGGAVGLVGGMFFTDGYARQIPKGGLIRATKFSTIGAIAGAVIPVVGMAVATGLAAAGVIGLGTAATVCSGGLALIIPLIILGVVAGWKYAGMTGKDYYQEEVADSFEKDMTFEAPRYLEDSFFARAASLA